ncbi:GH43 family beta-xylosidase [Actinoalloteichus hoggarensis]|uniref:Extracellular exo-alpha-(1->5)-L-arabinofuranosidase n=1 Tax=Actinoalloteichus hoggarensis TaxID=1470176 RepID=A0A221W5G2_9PSEU|nr:family 43 glycosylhydrolase [Actinoalloteichus hoggarensis]ASO21182.1 Extracellular exo-alpha-(1->5)-L-arabinofuranosidase precursor [Actinoalloteichus hoggarensis]MBB5921112.1 GH43 family beta-xylosidase [Actinoalloteichus hoggarensis]
MIPINHRRRGRWRAAIVFVASILAVGAVPAPPPAAAAVAVDPAASYVLVNRHSGKALDVYELATGDGARIAQYSRNDGAWQQWRFLDSGGGWYRLRSHHSDKVLEFVSTADAVDLVQNTDANRPSQQFRLAESPDGHVRLINRVSGKAADVWEWSTDDGARVVQWPDTGGENQQWRLVQADATPPGTFANPIKHNGPDPWLQYHDGFYYLATTTWNSTITMRRSRTLAGLASAADQVVFDLSGRPNGCCNMWAPEFHLIDGRWYLYYVAGQDVEDFNPTQRLHVLESAGTDPMGPYSFKADLGDTWELDPSILRHDGRLYLLGSAMDGTQSLTITPLSNPWTISGARRTISQPTLPWERQTHPVNEGAEPLYQDGRTMIVYSASACWGPDYKLGLLTLTGSDPLDRSHWTKSPNPVFQRHDGNGVFAPGHNGFFTSPDGTESWIVYHANDSASGGCDMNRSTRAQRFTWNADGTPDFGVPVRLGTTLPAPSGESTF